MYHELTYRQIWLRRVRRIIALALIVAVSIALYVLISTAQANAHEQAALALRDTVLASARQCCAVEGSYPASLSHLEQNYGLTINHDAYVVSYEWFADNVMPTVVVTPR